MSLADHLEELRARVLLALAGLAVGVIAGFFLAKDAFLLLEYQYTKILPGKPLITLAPTDAFVGYTRIAIILGFILASPWVFYQRLEIYLRRPLPSRKKIRLYRHPVFGKPFYYRPHLSCCNIAPVTLSFFVEFGKWLGVESTWTFPAYLSFITFYMSYFRPYISDPDYYFVLIKMGLVSCGTFATYRKSSSSP